MTVYLLNFLSVAQTGHLRRLLPYCRSEIDTTVFGDASTQELYVIYDDNTIVAWLWCLFFVFSVPETLTFLRSVWFCIMRTVNRPNW